MASPRTIAFSLCVIVLGLLLSHRARRGGYGHFAYVFRQALPLVAFSGFAAASALWAMFPFPAMKVSLEGAVWLIAGILGSAAMMGETRRNQFHLAEGLWIGFIAGLLYLLVELLTDQSIKIFLYNALSIPKPWLRPPAAFKWSGDLLVAISPHDLARSIAPITLLLWSSLLCLRSTAPGGQWKLWSAGVYALAVLVIVLSVHETSKVAIVVSSLIFVLSLKSVRGAAWLLRVGWVLACLAAVPVSLALYRAGLHKAPWLQMTAQHRVVIWNHTAESTLKAPYVGVGAGSMYQMDARAAAQRKQSIERLSPNARHAHNVYLQTWLELGAVGAALLALVGLGLIEAIQSLHQRQRPYAHATLAAVMCIAAASYGMWQAWFLAMFALTAVCFVLAYRVDTPRDDDAPLTA